MLSNSQKVIFKKL